MKISGAVFRDQVEGVGFVKVPLLVLLDSRLGMKSKLVYTLLRHYAWQGDVCHPGRARLANDLGLSEKTIQGAIEALEKVGLVTQERKGQGKTNVYWIEPLRSVYGVNKSNALSRQAMEWCRLEAPVLEAEKDIDPEPVRVDMGASRLKEVVESARTKSNEATERRIQLRKVSSGSGKKTAKIAKSYKNGYRPKQLQEVWKRAWEDSFPGITCSPWGPKEFSQLAKMVEYYGPEQVKEVLDYIPRHWEEIRQWDSVQVAPFPDLQFILGFRSKIYPAVQNGEPFWSTKKRASIDRDEYTGKHDGAEDGYF